MHAHSTAYRPFQVSRTFYNVNAMNTVPEAGKPAEPFRVVIGFNNQELSATWPFIELVATPERLEFRARLGLGRFMGPWSVERSMVTKIFRAPGLMMGDCIAVRGKHYLDWTIYAFSLEPILLTLEELGYPVDWIHRTP